MAKTKNWTLIFEGEDNFEYKHDFFHVRLLGFLAVRNGDSWWEVSLLELGIGSRSLGIVPNKEDARAIALKFMRKNSGLIWLGRRK